ncbi:TMEM165/GDT1 family protein [Altericista sp. CCNU0014]|uniref:TMEM165/GDT1 family protein n=1 Tax=Altericista sp. CCNU0014 TaxID=3082949 RepID=UPI0038515D3E
MDWKLFAASFVMVFIAELGDKSQLTAITLSGQCQNPRAVFLGSACALILASFLGVLMGEGFARVLPTHLLKAAAASGFAAMGLGLLWKPQRMG